MIASKCCLITSINRSPIQLRASTFESSNMCWQRRIWFDTLPAGHVCNYVTLESGNYDGRLRSNRTCAKAILRRLMDLIKQHHAQNPPPQISMLKNTGVDNKPFWSHRCKDDGKNEMSTLKFGGRGETMKEGREGGGHVGVSKIFYR